MNEDLGNDLFHAELRALGIIAKIVTGPFWRIVENVDNIYSINPHIKKMAAVLTEWSEDANPLFKGEEMFIKEPGLMYDDDLVKKDILYEELFKDSGNQELDVMTIQALEHICHAILIIAVEDFCFIVDLLDYGCEIPLTSGGGSGAWVLRKIAHLCFCAW